MRSLNIAATGMLAQQLNVEVISNNIANLNTTAYQRRRAEFQDLLYQNQRRVGSASSDGGTIVPVGVQIGLGVKTAAVYRITEQGNLSLTENNLDMAISGRGYFQIQRPNGTNSYTRSGAFQLSNTGQIVTADGYLVQPGIVVPEDAREISINPNGQVSVTLNQQDEPIILGQLQLAIFANEGGLIATGDNLFNDTVASGPPILGVPDQEGFGAITQGFLETSNVNVVEEISQLITAQRAYEMNSKIIETSDQMMAAVSNIR